MLLSGDAGVGKTRLLTALGEYALSRDALVLTGRCIDVREGGLSYLPFAEALAPLAGSTVATIAEAVKEAARARQAAAAGAPAARHAGRQRLARDDELQRTRDHAAPQAGAGPR